MISPTSLPISSVRSRTGLFVAVLLLINVVMDGLPQLGSQLVMQVALVPLSLLFLLLSFLFLAVGEERNAITALADLAVKLGSLEVLAWILALLELSFIGLLFYQTSHFEGLGYQRLGWPAIIMLATFILAMAIVIGFPTKVSEGYKLATFLGTYVAGHVLAIVYFPLNYMRSDMLPVIFWADRALLAGQNPYQHFHVGDRIYDFPYLPGMLLVFAPAQALKMDLRWAVIAYLIAGMYLIYREAKVAYRPQVVSLIGLFVLCPYLQYRHELYTQGHFLSLIIIFCLMRRGLFAWSAAVFGLSMTISQFSWIIFPFFLLNALRRRGWKEVGRMALLTAIVMAVLMAPFMVLGAGDIAHNAVGQWDLLARPIARPINLSFWASYVVRPINLKWVQLAILSGIFGFCWLKGRCVDLADTLRWMIAALIVFILLNVLVDGYFYLMLLVPMLVYTCVANEWWVSPERISKRVLEPVT